MLETRSFENCLQQIRAALAAFAEEPSYAAAEAICLETRDGWSAYLTQFLLDPASCTPSLRRDFAAALTEGLEHLGGFVPPESLTAKQRDRVPGFLEAVETRAHLLRLLHERGREAVREELERRMKAG